MTGKIGVSGSGWKLGMVAALLALLTAACAGPRTIADDAPLIAPGHVLTLPTPGDLGRSVQATQMITVRRDGETHVFEGNISVTPDKLQLIGLDALGRRAMNVVWEKSGKITAETASWLPEAVKPGPMLADIVLLYWPEDVVRRILEETGAELVVRPGGRSIMLDGDEIIRAEYLEGGDAAWTGRLRYRNTSWGYEIEVQSAESAAP